MLKNEPFMSYQRFKKCDFSKEVSFYFFIKYFLVCKKKAGTTYELLICIFYSGKSQHNFTINKMGNFQGDLLKCLIVSWNDPEMLAKALFDGPKAKNMA